MQPLEVNYTAVNRAFTSQSAHFDTDETGNVVLAAWRQHIYSHVSKFLQPSSSLLELNAGTGIDAVHFAEEGHHVLATDLSDGMALQMEQKARLIPRLVVRQISFENLDALDGQKFDFVFSNFGGLNCAEDLTGVTKHLPSLLKANACLTFVIMPKVCPWEWLWVLKGKWRDAFRRFSTHGAEAAIDGFHFRAFYHSPTQVQRALGPDFRLEQSEGLGIFSPPPSAQNFVRRFPRLSLFLSRLDGLVQKTAPFNRCGDHVILTFRYLP